MATSSKLTPKFNKLLKDAADRLELCDTINHVYSIRRLVSLCIETKEQTERQACIAILTKTMRSGSNSNATFEQSTIESLKCLACDALFELASARVMDTLEFTNQLATLFLDPQYHVTSQLESHILKGLLYLYFNQHLESHFTNILNKLITASDSFYISILSFTEDGIISSLSNESIFSDSATPIQAIQWISLLAVLISHIPKQSSSTTYKYCFERGVSILSTIHTSYPHLTTHPETINIWTNMIQLLLQVHPSDCVSHLLTLSTLRWDHSIDLVLVTIDFLVRSKLDGDGSMSLIRVISRLKTYLMQFIANADFIVSKCLLSNFCYVLLHSVLSWQVQEIAPVFDIVYYIFESGKRIQSSTMELAELAALIFPSLHLMRCSIVPPNDKSNAQDAITAITSRINALFDECQSLFRTHFDMTKSHEPEAYKKEILQILLSSSLHRYKTISLVSLFAFSSAKLFATCNKGTIEGLASMNSHSVERYHYKGFLRSFFLVTRLFSADSLLRSVAVAEVSTAVTVEPTLPSIVLPLLVKLSTYEKKSSIRELLPFAISACGLLKSNLPAAYGSLDVVAKNFRNSSDDLAFARCSQAIAQLSAGGNLSFSKVESWLSPLSNLSPEAASIRADAMISTIKNTEGGLDFLSVIKKYLSLPSSSPLLISAGYLALCEVLVFHTSEASTLANDPEIIVQIQPKENENIQSSKIKYISLLFDILVYPKMDLSDFLLQFRDEEKGALVRKEEKKRIQNNVLPPFVLSDWIPKDKEILTTLLQVLHPFEAYSPSTRAQALRSLSKVIIQLPEFLGVNNQILDIRVYFSGTEGNETRNKIYLLHIWVPLFLHWITSNRVLLHYLEETSPQVLTEYLNLLVPILRREREAIGRRDVGTANNANPKNAFLNEMANTIKDSQTGGATDPFSIGTIFVRTSFFDGGTKKSYNMHENLVRGYIDSVKVEKIPSFLTHIALTRLWKVLFNRLSRETGLNNYSTKILSFLMETLDGDSQDSDNPVRSANVFYAIAALSRVSPANYSASVDFLLEQLRLRLSSQYRLLEEEKESVALLSSIQSLHSVRRIEEFPSLLEEILTRKFDGEEGAELVISNIRLSAILAINSIVETDAFDKGIAACFFVYRLISRLNGSEDIGNEFSLPFFINASRVRLPEQSNNNTFIVGLSSSLYNCLVTVSSVIPSTSTAQMIGDLLKRVLNHLLNERNGEIKNSSHWIILLSALLPLCFASLVSLNNWNDTTILESATMDTLSEASRKRLEESLALLPSAIAFLEKVLVTSDFDDYILHSLSLFIRNCRVLLQSSVLSSIRQFLTNCNLLKESQEVTTFETRMKEVEEKIVLHLATKSSVVRITTKVYKILACSLICNFETFYPALESLFSLPMEPSISNPYATALLRSLSEGGKRINIQEKNSVLSDISLSEEQQYIIMIAGFALLQMRSIRSSSSALQNLPSGSLIQQALILLDNTRTLPCISHAELRSKYETIISTWRVERDAFTSDGDVNDFLRTLQKTKSVSLLHQRFLLFSLGNIPSLPNLNLHNCMAPFVSHQNSFLLSSLLTFTAAHVQKDPSLANILLLVMPKLNSHSPVSIWVAFFDAFVECYQFLTVKSFLDVCTYCSSTFGVPVKSTNLWILFVLAFEKMCYKLRCELTRTKSQMAVWISKGGLATDFSGSETDKTKSTIVLLKEYIFTGCNFLFDSLDKSDNGLALYHHTYSRQGNSIHSSSLAVALTNLVCQYLAVAEICQETELVTLILPSLAPVVAFLHGMKQPHYYKKDKNQLKLMKDALIRSETSSSPQLPFKKRSFAIIANESFRYALHAWSDLVSLDLEATKEALQSLAVLLTPQNASSSAPQNSICMKRVVIVAIVLMAKVFTPHVAYGWCEDAGPRESITHGGDKAEEERDAQLEREWKTALVNMLYCPSWDATQYIRGHGTRILSSPPMNNVHNKFVGKEGDMQRERWKRECALWSILCLDSKGGKKGGVVSEKGFSTSTLDEPNACDSQSPSLMALSASSHLSLTRTFPLPLVKQLPVFHEFPNNVSSKGETESDKAMAAKKVARCLLSRHIPDQVWERIAEEVTTTKYGEGEESESISRAQYLFAVILLTDYVLCQSLETVRNSSEHANLMGHILSIKKQAEILMPDIQAECINFLY